MRERTEVEGNLGPCWVTETKGSKHFKKEVVPWLSFVHICVFVLGLIWRLTETKRGCIFSRPGYQKLENLVVLIRS